MGADLGQEMTALNSTLYTGKAQGSFLVGGFGAAAAFSGLYGPVAGIPASLLSLMFLPAAVLALLLAGTRASPPLAWLAIVPSIIVCLLLLSHASPLQIAFLFDPTQWHLRQERYVDAKLLAVLIAFIPQLAALIMVAFVQEREKAIKGVFFVLATLATLAALRILVEQGSGLIRTDKVTASNALLSSRYSLVSYGLLLTIGSVAPLVFRRGWMLSGVLLFFTALICRRADVISLMVCLIALSIYFGVTRGGKIGSKSFYALILGMTLFAGLHNEYNIAYFSAIGRAIELRTGMVSESLATLSEEEEQEANDIQNPMEDSTASQDSASSEQSTGRFKIFFGAGLGQYQNVTHSEFAYPHNVAIEILIELGVVAFSSFLFLILFPFWAIGFRIIKKSPSETAIYSTACLCIAIAFSLKAGEMSDLGRITFLSGLVLLACQDSQRSAPRLQSTPP